MFPKVQIIVESLWISSLYFSISQSAHHFTGVITAIDINQNKSIQFQKQFVFIDMFIHFYGQAFLQGVPCSIKNRDSKTV